MNEISDQRFAVIDVIFDDVGAGGEASDLSVSEGLRSDKARNSNALRPHSSLGCKHHRKFMGIKAKPVDSRFE